jgi:hypothetical protein
LPPVNLDISPALDIQTLGLNYNKEVEHIELDEVMRQEEDSGFCIMPPNFELLKDPFITTSLTSKVQRYCPPVDGYDIQDAINSASNYSIEDTAFIVRSNKRANQYNEQIRTKILDKESELSTGDFLMVVKNIILA